MARFRVALVGSDVGDIPEHLPKKLEATGVELSVSDCWTKEDLVRHAADADVVWICGGRPICQGENLKVLEKCGAIVRSGTGTDNVDLKTATELGILVVNTPYAIADTVADHTIALLFSLVRLVTRHDRAVHRGEWDSMAALPHRRFRSATLGLVAFGRIPRDMVQKLSGFHMSFVAYDPYAPVEAMASLGVRSLPLDEVLRASDYVSLHSPLTEKTEGMIGERELRLMQPHSVLVNTARGKVVDEKALVRALQEGWIAGAALDVLESEPPEPDNPLLTMENVIITPHSGGHADTWPEEFCGASVDAIIDLAQGRYPRSVVNADVKPRWDKLSPPRQG